MKIQARWICVATLLGACAAYAVLAARVSPLAGAPLRSAASSVHSDPPAPPAHILRFSPPSLDFGEIPLGERRTAEVRVENVSREPLVVRDVLGGCGCVRAEFPVRTIPPGGSGALRVTYSAIGVGQTQRVVTHLLLDHPGCPQAGILVRAIPRQQVVIEPAVLQFGILRKDATMTLDAVARSVDGRPFEIRPFILERPEFEISCQPLGAGRKDAYRLRVTARASSPGRWTEAAKLTTDDSGAVRAILYLTLAVERGVALEPSFVTSAVGADRRVGPFLLTLVRSTPGDLKVTRVRESRDLPVDFEVERVKEGRLKLRIRMTGEPPEVPRFGQFLIETDLEAEPVLAAYRIDAAPRGRP